MKVHHFDATTFCPRFGLGQMVCHSLLIEGRDGLVLVDGGMGQPASLRRHDPVLRLVGRPRIAPEQTALAQVQRLGFTPADVRHIVLTHLDVDHAGALVDFPAATVHVHGAELDAALARKTFFEKRRYQPWQWAHQVRWQRHAPGGDTWQGFAAARDLAGCQGDLLLVPLQGHTWGHAGVAVKADDGWLLHAGDAYFRRAELEGGAVPRGVGRYVRLMAMDDDARRHNLARLGELARSQPEIRLFSAHDPDELADFS